MKLSEDGRVAVARVIKAHGVKGQVSIEPLSDFKKRLTEIKDVVVLTPQGKLIPCRVEEASTTIVKLSCWNDREQAKTARDSLITIAKNQVKPLPAGRYYHFELEGLDVYDSKQGFLGKVVEVLSTGSNDIYVVRNGSQEVMIPALKSVVKRIDIKAGRMDVEQMDWTS